MSGNLYGNFKKKFFKINKIKHMLAAYLIKKAFKISINKKLISQLFLPYLILNYLPRYISEILSWNNFVDNDFVESINTSSLEYILIFVIFFGYCAFFSLTIKAINSFNANTRFCLPNVKKILLDSYRLMLAGFVSWSLIAVGAICFVIPGLILFKRYQYVLIFTEEESIGLEESLLKSKKLALNKGWVVFSSLLISGLIILFLTSFISFIIIPFRFSLVHFILYSIPGWFGAIFFPALIISAKNKLSPS